MKVAYILKYFPKNSETFIHEEIYQLIKKGVKVRIFSLTKGKTEKNHKKVEYILQRVKLKTYSWSPLSIINNILELKKETFLLPELTIRIDVKSLLKDINDFNPDYIHTHFMFERAELTSYIAKKVNKPFSITCHAKDIYHPNIRRIKKVGERANKVITISEFNRRLLIKQGVRLDKIEVIHCGIDLQDFTLSKEKNRKKKIILSIGRFVEKKGFIYLLKASKILKDKGEDIDLRIIGYGPLERSLKKFVRDNKLNVHFIGKTVDEETQKEIDHCDLFVLACVKSKDGDMDGIPVVLMEAMAKGKTVISTNLSGIPELIDDQKNGYLINPNNEFELAEAILKFNKLYPVTIRSKIEEEFNSSKEVEKLLKVWKNA